MGTWKWIWIPNNNNTKHHRHLDSPKHLWTRTSRSLVITQTNPVFHVAVSDAVTDFLYPRSLSTQTWPSWNKCPVCFMRFPVWLPVPQSLGLSRARQAPTPTPRLGNSHKSLVSSSWLKEKDDCPSALVMQSTYYTEFYGGGHCFPTLHFSRSIVLHVWLVFQGPMRSPLCSPTVYLSMQG